MNIFSSTTELLQLFFSGLYNAVKISTSLQVDLNKDCFVKVVIFNYA